MPRVTRRENERALRRWRTKQVANEVRAERNRQDTLWGEQNHPDGTNRAYDVEHRDALLAFNEVCVDRGTLTWRDILDEEVAEAFAESDPERLRAELIQVAAVAVNWVESIDRRTR